MVKKSMLWRVDVKLLFVSFCRRPFFFFANAPHEVDISKMEPDNTNGAPCPILIIPKVCTKLESNYGTSENVYINLNILSSDTEGNRNVLYNGMCHIKLVETNQNVTIMCHTQNSDTSSENLSDVLTEANQITFPEYNDSPVWIDPSKSPFVYNQCDTPPLETYTIMEEIDNRVTIKQHNTYITQNVYNYNEAPRYSPVSNGEHEIITITEPIQSNNFSMYEEDELECSVYLSQLSEDIINEKATWDRDERKFVQLETANEALKQLMSKDIQSATRQHKTILFLGHDPESGQTVQNITINDPMLECMMNGDVDNEVVIEEINAESVPGSKKFQCNKCKRMFDHIVAFKQHMVGKHRSYSPHDLSNNVRFKCMECGKYLKNQDKLDQHHQAHGDPELECNKCHKVFASKFTLRVHRKIHSRMYSCEFCARSYTTAPEIYAHKIKVHNIFTCEQCSWSCNNSQNFASHQLTHKADKDANNDYSVFNDNLPAIEDGEVIEEIVVDDKTQEDDLVLAKIRSIPFFHSNNKSKTKIYGKNCELCFKRFDRLSDLKRHLIEHVVRITLAKDPVNEFGVLNICCEICQEKAFNSVDKYKAHLREHAKLTLYKCTFCDKSFSDSSNFSKHKKIHGAQFLQCDICQRKFNSKKMLIQHMEYHKKNRPLYCQHCSKVFYFKSSLNKHMKSSHFKGSGKYKCTFCSDVLDCLKKKWDHEWMVHNVRKVIIDCLYCGSKFRKFAQLKQHCLNVHDITIPPTKRLLKLKMKNKTPVIEE